MSATELGLVASVFLACAVEAVEALTIVLAVGSTRSWRSALIGVALAVLALAVLVAVLGPALTSLPINVLRAVIGGVLLIFGLGWLRKAILRASGLKRLRDEDAAFDAQRSRALAAGSASTTFDSYACLVSFNGAFLEGVEVALIAVTFGSTQHDIPAAALAALAAVLVVAVAGIAFRAPLARVPENALKFTVGILTTSFGTFWGAEGAGARWPGGETALVAIIPAVAVFSILTVRLLRASLDAPATSRAPALP